MNEHHDRGTTGTSNVGATNIGAPDPLQKETNTWALIMHLSLLGGFLLPGAGLIAPIVIYLLKKDALPGLVAHGNVVFNWLVSFVVYAVIGALLSIVLIGVPILIALVLVSFIFPIIGAIKASDGIVWCYPLSIPVFKSAE